MFPQDLQFWGWGLGRRGTGSPVASAAAGVALGRLPMVEESGRAGGPAVPASCLAGQVRTGGQPPPTT